MQATLLLVSLLPYCSAHGAPACATEDSTCSNVQELDAAQSSKALVQAFRKSSRGAMQLREGGEIQANVSAAAHSIVWRQEPARRQLWSASLDQEGYDWVKQLDCHFEKELFARRVANSLSYHFCDERSMQDLILKHFQADAYLDYEGFKTDLVAFKDGNCPAIVSNGERCIQTAPEGCPEVRWTPHESLGGWKDDPVHRRRTCRNKNPGVTKIGNLNTDFVPEEQPNSFLQTAGVARVTARGTPGTSSPLDDTGLQEVKKTESEDELEYFVRRVVAKNMLHVCQEGGLMGAIEAYVQAGELSQTGSLNYMKLESDITAATQGNCPWLGEGPVGTKGGCRECASA